MENCTELALSLEPFPFDKLIPAKVLRGDDTISDPFTSRIRDPVKALKKTLAGKSPSPFC